MNHRLLHHCSSFLGLLMITFSLVACEKEVSIDLPETEEDLVVEGTIEPGQPPFIMLIKTQGYFEPTDVNSFEETFVSGASMTLDDGSRTVELTEICTDDLPEAFLPFVGDLTGFSNDVVANSNICIYTALDTSGPIPVPSMEGEIGKTYSLSIEAKGKTLSAITTIPKPVPLDSLWFQLNGDEEQYGFAWALLDDPETRGNAYRWGAKRLGQDDDFIHPFGSVFEDRFFNGKEFEFNYPRPPSPSPDNNEADDKGGLYQTGDTIVVKFSTITLEVYQFYSSFEQAQANTGSPFASPSNVESNVEGGLGIWAGFGVTYDTTVADP